MAVTVAFTDQPSAVLDAAGDMLASSPVAHNLVLSLLSNRVAHPVPGRYWIAAVGDEPVGVAMQSPTTYAATLTPMPGEAVVAVVAAIAAAGVDLPGVTGDATTAARFAGQWAECTNVAVEPTHAQRIYELQGPAPERGVDGCVRPADSRDLDLVLGWMRGFDADTGERGSDDEGVITRRLGSGQFWLWEHGGPCSVAAHTVPEAGAVRIQAVYTPAPRRGRGYAGACVSALSAHLQGAGHRCILYADLSNPTSNALYRRIGYQSVVECLRYRFSGGRAREIGV